MDNIELMEMIKKAQKMIDNNEVPEEIKVMARNMQNSNNADASKISLNQQNKQSDFNNSQQNKQQVFNDNYQSKQQSFSNNYQNRQQDFNDNNNNNSNIDINNVMKLLNSMNLNNINFNNDDDLTRLLFAIKPYLRNERKEKVDEYVKLIKLGKMAELFEKLNNNK